MTPSGWLGHKTSTQTNNTSLHRAVHYPPSIVLIWLINVERAVKHIIIINLIVLVLKFELVHFTVWYHLSKSCKMSGKQYRPWSNTAWFGVWSGSKLVAHACSSKYLRLFGCFAKNLYKNSRWFCWSGHDMQPKLQRWNKTKFLAVWVFIEISLLGHLNEYSQQMILCKN